MPKLNSIDTRKTKINNKFIGVGDRRVCRPPTLGINPGKSEIIRAPNSSI